MGNVKWLLLLVVCLCLNRVQAEAGVMQSPDSTMILRGVVKDAQSRKRLPNVNVFIPGRDVGTMTNDDGTFVLKVTREATTGELAFSCLGYAGRRLSISEWSGSQHAVNVYLVPESRLLSEVTVYGGDAKELVYEALARVGANYPLQPNMLQMFYRETIMKGSRFVGISEGVLDVFKEGYKHRSMGKDRVRIERGRRLLSQKSRDTLAIKVQGGPTLAVHFDVVKNPDFLFDAETMGYYAFRHERMDVLGDRLHYVVSFKPLVKVEYPLYSGLLYIDMQTLCLSRAECSLDVSNEEKVNKMLLQKKPAGLRFRVREASMVIAYRPHGQRSTLDYVKSTIRFKCDWKRRLFASSYAAVAEMVTVDVDHAPKGNIPLQEAFGSKRLFDDEAEANWDADYWADYNIIEPTESLEKAVKKLRKQQQ
ncbi:MAG: carboxypeptidase-like regulatory domain-containing protein [Bacteroides sp.]